MKSILVILLVGTTAAIGRNSHLRGSGRDDGAALVKNSGGIYYPTCTKPGEYCQYLPDPNGKGVKDFLRDKVYRAVEGAGRKTRVSSFMFAYRKRFHDGFNYVMTYQQPLGDEEVLYSCVIALFEDSAGKEHLYKRAFKCDKGYETTNNMLIDWVIEGKPIPGQDEGFK